MRTIRGMIYTDKMLFEAGEITVEGDTIEKIELCGQDKLTQEEAGRYILPGLIDTHFHGCAQDMISVTARWRRCRRLAPTR